MRFWRIQDTKEQEAHSLHIDIPEILTRKEHEDIEDLLDLYEDTIELRNDPDALRNELRQGELADAARIGDKFPLEGLCGYESDDDEPPYPLEATNFGPAAGNKFWVLYEGEYLGDCDDGDIFRPYCVVRVVEK